MRIKIHPEAMAEARSVRNWYASHSPDAAQAFMAEFDAAVKSIADRPNTWPLFEAQTRRYVFRRFPYYILYRHNEDTVQIVALMHSRQRPGYWHRRK